MNKKMICLECGDRKESPNDTVMAFCKSCGSLMKEEEEIRNERK